MIFFSNKNRPFHYGPYPLERLPRYEAIVEFERQKGQDTRPVAGDGASSNYAAALEKYHKIFKQFCEGDVAPAEAPVPDDLERRSIDVKGAGYFLDAGQIGICELTDSCKHPFAAAMLKQIRGMVPHHDGPVAETEAAELNDPETNTRALKSLSYALESEITGICEIPDYA